MANNSNPMQEKLDLIKLSAKFDLETIEDGSVKVTPKDEEAGLTGVVKNGEYELYPTTIEKPLNIPALNEINKFCKLMLK